jgi:predicted ATPase with chaperone activity
VNNPAREVVPEPAAALVPAPITSLEETGLSRDLLTSLLLKTLYQRAGATGFELGDALALPFAIVDELLRDLQYDHLVEIREADGPTRTAFRFALTSKGRENAMGELVANRYVGPAPVPLPQYVEWVQKQSMSNMRIDRSRLEDALDELVLPDDLIELIGPALNSAKSMFLYGEPGNGKTRIAQAVADIFGEAFYVPHAVELDGLLMVLFDPVHHKPMDAPAGSQAGPTIVRDVPQHDRRFVRVRRPVVTAGGELALEHLDLRYDSFARTYQAPIHLKANGGIMFVDDLGRQRVSPRELLNRWIVPLEHRVDHLSLHNGKTITVPFDTLVVFATNIEPAQLVEEAFLRRIHYKIHVPDPEPDQYDRIFSDCCDQIGLDFDPAAPELVRREYYATGRAQPRGCHPRDILGHLRDIAQFQGLPVSLSPDLLRRACDSVFVPVERSASASRTAEVLES